mmetsp:Transcript_5540/g.18835  ORF Transcript_5540/g.18835 Transcript_5540/m.18835 type:complete len:245 (-) Transcript_5540:636-1370(-)
MTTMGSLALAMLLIARVRPQAMGDGVSKYTLPCNAPEAPMQWMEKYLPVITSSDSCEGAADDWLGVDNDCVCSTANETLETVAQGRVQLYGDRGFGLHLVNTSFKLTTGGLSVAAVEAVFEERLNDMDHFDAYMDYSVAFYAPPTGPRALDAFVEAFDADNVSYYPYMRCVCMPRGGCCACDRQAASPELCVDPQVPLDERDERQRVDLLRPLCPRAGVHARHRAHEQRVGRRPATTFEGPGNF